MSSRLYIVLFVGLIYELNLSVFNEIFGFPPSFDVPMRKVPHQFNPNTFWHLIAGDYNYNTSSCCTHI